MNYFKISAVAALVGLTSTVLAADELTSGQEAVAKAVPKKMTILIASFGNIESQAQAEKWLGEALPPKNNLAQPPTLSEGEKCANPALDKEIVRLNWNTRKIEYIREANAVEAENIRNRQLLNALRMKVLTDDASRYVVLGKDYLQSALSRKGGRLFQIVDRSSIDATEADRQLTGADASFAGAGCILTATLGDREEDSKEVTMNAKGTKVLTTIYTQPYTFKVRDLYGNVLMAEDGTVTWQTQVNNLTKSKVADPARKLVEAVCKEIADKMIAFFTVKLGFEVKAPKGMDKDDATVRLDGKTIDADESVRVLAVEHAVVATLENCKSIRRLIELDSVEDGAKTVKLVFKKSVSEDVED